MTLVPIVMTVMLLVVLFGLESIRMKCNHNGIYFYPPCYALLKLVLATLRCIFFCKFSIDYPYPYLPHER